MDTITLKVYEFSELSEKAKDRARQDMEATFSYTWAHEALESIRKLAQHFGGKVKDYSLDWFNGSPSWMTFDMPDDMTRKEIKALLSELGTYNKRTGRGHGDCKLTGICSDEDAIDGFRLAFRAGTSDLDTLMQAAYKTWIKACWDDCDGMYSDEGMEDMSEANEYHFFEDGEIAPAGEEVK